jgi:hypothetical protein
MFQQTYHRRVLEMGGSAPPWLRYAVTSFAVCVFVYCLWTGKVGFRGSRRVAMRAKDPFDYWMRMSLLAAMIGYLLYESVR